MKTKFLVWAVVAAIGGLAMTSIASAVTVTHYPNSDVEYTLNWNEHFTAWTITIVDWDDIITILDRNLWATAAGTGCEDPDFLNVCSGWDATYWYHFQWWNNYWFDPMVDSITANSVTTKEPWLIEYSNRWYVWSVFIKSTVAPYDYWSDNGNHYDVWWWLASDVPNYDNNWVWKITNWTGRQWPCPSGFHVPSYWELSKLWSMFNNSVSEIHRNLLLPFAGYRWYSDAIVYNLWTWANVDTSSPNVSLSTQVISPYNKWTSLSITGTIGIWSASRANGVSVRCFYDSYETYTKLNPGEMSAQINLSVIKWTLTIWTTTWNLNLWEVNVSNSAQELSWSFGADSFWVEDMKWLETGYRTTISVSNLSWTVPTHVISASNVSLKTAWATPNYISWASVDDSQVVFGSGMTSWHNNWAAPVTYFNRQNTPSNLAWRVWKWWDNLQIKVNIPAHTPYDTYRWTITYTLYDLDS